MTSKILPSHSAYPSLSPESKNPLPVPPLKKTASLVSHQVLGAGQGVVCGCLVSFAYPWLVPFVSNKMVEGSIYCDDSGVIVGLIVRHPSDFL